MDFNESQLKAIDHFEGNCCVLASAGSGKTSVLVHRTAKLIQEHNINPYNILAITFSNKARDNMKNKINDLLDTEDSGVIIDTFHALGYKILRDNGYGYLKLLPLWQQKQIINNIVIKILYLEDDDKDVKTNSIMSYISYQKNNLIDCESKQIQLKDMPYGLQKMKEIYQKYETAKISEKLIDFDDMLINSFKLLNSNVKIRDKYADKFKFILVDEFQDTNKAMYEILRLLGKKNNNVFVVGDPLQNIYEWNCADNNYILDFYKDWIDTTIIPMNINYRSSQNIVTLSNKLVKGMKETTHNNYYEAVADKPLFKESEYQCYIDEVDEAEKIVCQIKTFKEKGYNYSDIAILTRTNFMIQPIEKCLYINNIAYEIVGGRTFYELKEIKDMIAYIRLIADSNNDEAFLQIYNSPNRYLGAKFIEEVSTYAKRHKESLFDSISSFPRSNEWRYKKGINELYSIINKINRRKRYKVGELIDIIRNDLEYDKYVLKESYENNDKNEKIENLDTLVIMANQYNNINTFLSDIDKLLNFTNDKQQIDKIKLMTIHKAKGLEFPIVFITGVNNTLLPHAKSDNENEEKRLFYVAITRAEQELHISSTSFYHDKAMSISPFIYDIFDNLSD